jgi:energy-coupling factor transporter ATP-binding protein EcfA2
MAFIALQGKPGSGKSTMAATMTKLGFHTHYIDMDGKVKTTRNLQPLLDEGKISYIECPEPLNQRSLKLMANSLIKDMFPKMQPKGYAWFCDYIDNLPEEISSLGIDPSKTVPVVDSLTAVNRHLKNLMRYYQKSPKLGFDGWDAVLQNYQAVFDELRRMTPDPFPHLIVNIHVRDDVVKDGENVITEFRPFLDGQFRDEIASYFEEFYFLEVQTAGKSGKSYYKSITKPVGPIQHARSSMGVGTMVNSDFGEILAEEA